MPKPKPIKEEKKSRPKGNELNSFKTDYECNNNEISSHRRPAKIYQITRKGGNSVRNRRDMIDLSSRPPWVGIGSAITHMKEKAAEEESKRLKIVVRTYEDTDLTDKSISIDEISERLHKGVRAKVKIPKPKRPRVLKVDLMPVIAPEVMMQIEDSYNKYLAASQPQVASASSSDDQVIGAPVSRDSLMCEEIFMNMHPLNCYSDHDNQRQAPADVRPEYMQSVPGIRSGYIQSVPEIRPEYMQSVPEIRPEYMESVPGIRQGYMQSAPELRQKYMQSAPQMRSEYMRSSHHFDHVEDRRYFDRGIPIRSPNMYYEWRPEPSYHAPDPQNRPFYYNYDCSRDYADDKIN